MILFYNICHRRDLVFHMPSRTGPCKHMAHLGEDLCAICVAMSLILQFWFNLIGVVFCCFAYLSGGALCVEPSLTRSTPTPEQLWRCCQTIKGPMGAVRINRWAGVNIYGNILSSDPMSQICAVIKFITECAHAGDSWEYLHRYIIRGHPSVKTKYVTLMNLQFKTLK